MQIIVIGCGKVGSNLASTLSRDGHDVVIVDSDAESFRMIDSDYRGMTVSGVPIDQDVLKKAGIETANVIAAVTPNDNINIMACQIAKEIFKVPYVLARIFNPAREHIFHQFGLQTICPTNMTVDIIRSMILGDKAIIEHKIGNDVFGFVQKKAQKTEMGKTIKDIQITEGSMIFGVVQEGIFKFSNAVETVKKDDILIFAQKAE